MPEQQKGDGNIALFYLAFEKSAQRDFNTQANQQTT
ncbi:hypothetical protein BD65_2515 [Yersinia ruckeri]|nr:hypothetical protein BD65_2515 [Yersinia ruckeri]